MCSGTYVEFEYLANKVQQHEQTITELVKIIAATNKKVSDLTTTVYKTHLIE